MIGRIPADSETVEWTSGPGIELHPAVVGARSAVESAGRRLLTIADTRLQAPWSSDAGDQDVRYGFYRLYELLEAAEGRVRSVLTAAGSCAPPGARRAAASTAARWSLHGVLISLADSDLDRDPGGDEWPIRETLGHIISSQRGYGRFTAWWLRRDRIPAEPLPDALRQAMPARDEEAAGSLDEIRARLDGLLDLGMARLGGVESLGVLARWSDAEVTVGFRLGRWASHLREHTIQVEKTLAMLDRQPTEVERLVRLLFAAYGQLEEAVFGMDPTLVAKQRGGQGSAADQISSVNASIDEIVPGILSAGQADAKA